MKKVVSFIGAPGCGKGFLIDKFVDHLITKRLVQKQDIEVISLGALIRSEIKNQTVLGEKMKASKKEGCLVPDYLITPLLQQKIHKSNASILILDGYPRTEKQWNVLTSTIPADALSIIFRDTDENTIRKRIQNRRICNLCGSPLDADVGICSCGGKSVRRKEDTVWEDRMEEYKAITLPMIRQIQNQPNVYTIHNSEIIESDVRTLSRFITDTKILRDD